MPSRHGTKKSRHPWLPLKILLPFHEPIRKHPEGANTPDDVNSYCLPRQHRMNFKVNMKKQPQMKDYRDADHNYPKCVTARLRFHTHPLHGYGNKAPGAAFILDVGITCIKDHAQIQAQGSAILERRRRGPEGPLYRGFPTQLALCRTLPSQTTRSTRMGLLQSLNAEC